MSSGIRATVGFSDPGDCSIAAAAAEAGTVITQASTSATPTDSRGSTTEFLIDGDHGALDDVEEVFQYGGATLYRTRHDGPESCPCECLGSHGCPVHRYEATGGRLTLVFHAPAFGTLQDVIADLQERYPPLDVQQLLRPPLDGTPEEQVFVDRGTLTDRQHEALRLAYEMGYFERPKRANATELAEELGITQSTFTEHLMTAQRKLLGDILD